MPEPEKDPFPTVHPPRQPKPISPGSSSDRFEKLRSARDELDRLRAHHLTIGEQVIAAGDGKILAADLAVMAMLQRSYGVLDALIDAVDTYNMHAAAPLLRLQLDTLYRISYMAGHSDANDLAVRLLNGEEFRTMKDSEGRNLSDGRLQELAKPNHEWSIGVYRETSGWVHFSLSHMRATTQAENNGTFFMSIPLRPTVLPESLWLEVFGAAARATTEIFDHMRGWVETKKQTLKSTFGTDA